MDAERTVHCAKEGTQNTWLALFDCNWVCLVQIAVGLNQ